jgi:hypothetical protein
MLFHYNSIKIPIIFPSFSYLVGGFNTLKNDGVCQLGFFPTEWKVIQNISKFHGSKPPSSYFIDSCHSCHWQIP